jgi:hypothetical protein
MTTSVLDTARDELYGRIGRNVVYFQKLEILLKFLVAYGNFEGPVEQISDVYTKRIETVRRLTLGSLIEPFIKQIYTKAENRQLQLENLHKAWISLAFVVDSDDSTVEKKKAALQELVSERNKLVHQMLADPDLDSVESCIRLGQFLDDQYKVVKAEHDILKEMVETMQSGRKEIANRLVSSLSSES